MQKIWIVTAFFILSSRNYAQMRHSQSVKSLVLDEKSLKNLYRQFLTKNHFQKNPGAVRLSHTLMLSGAVLSNDIEKVRECIGYGADVNGCCEVSGEPYLICALEKNFDDIAQLLLTKDITALAAWGYAAFNNRDDLMKRLHAMGAVTQIHDTRAAWRAIKAHLAHNEKKNSNKSLAYLLSHADVDVYSTREGLTLLEYAVINNQTDSVALLLSHSTNASLQRQALGLALNGSNKQMVDLLIASPHIYAMTEKLTEGPTFDADKCYTYASTHYSSDCNTPSEVQPWDGDFSSGSDSGYEPSYHYASPACPKNIAACKGVLLQENSFVEIASQSSDLPKNP